MISMTNVLSHCASACRTRRIALLDLQPTEFATDLTLLQGNNRIKVGDLGTRARSHSNSKSPDQVSPCRTKPDVPDSLMVGINGQVAGLIHFRRSDRLEAASALRRLRSKRNLRVGIISEQSHSSLASLTTSLGADFQIGGLSAGRSDPLSPELPQPWFQGRVRR